MQGGYTLPHQPQDGRAQALDSRLNSMNAARVKSPELVLCEVCLRFVKDLQIATSRAQLRQEVPNVSEVNNVVHRNEVEDFVLRREA